MNSAVNAPAGPIETDAVIVGAGLMVSWQGRKPQKS